MKRIIEILIVLILVSGCAPVLKQPQISKEAIEEEREKQKEIALITQLEKQERLYRVGFPLLKGAACFYNRKLFPAFGILVHSEKNYTKEYLPIIKKRYRVEKFPTILYLHPDFGGYSAGLKIDDRIVEIDGKKIDKIETLTKVLEAISSSTEVIDVLVERNGEMIKLNIPVCKICPFSFQLVPDDTINAWTNGQKIFVTTGLLRFLQSDTELALVLSHEIAHAVLDHVSKTLGRRVVGTIFDIVVTAATGVNTGGLLGDAGVLIYSKEFEKEADYLGTYIVAVSGYNIDDAANIWRKISGEYPGSIRDVFISTHPSTPERYLLIEKTVNEIKDKKEKGLLLIPEKK